MAPARRFPPCVMPHGSLPRRQRQVVKPRQAHHARPDKAQRDKQGVTGDGITIRHYDLWRFSWEMPDAPHLCNNLTPP